MRKLCLTLGLILFSLSCTTVDRREKRDTVRQHGKTEQALETPNLTTERERFSALRKRLRFLIQRLGDEEFVIRVSAREKIKSLFDTPDPDIFDTVLAELKEELFSTEDEAIRYNIERIAAPYIRWRMKGAILKKFPDIMEALSSSDPESRRDIARELGRWKHPDATGTLIVLLNDKDWRVRLEAVEALGYIASKEAVEPLIKLLEEETHFLFRGKISEALGRIGGERAIDALITVFGDAGEKVWEKVADAFERIGKSAVDRAIQKLSDERIRVRIGAARALRYIRDEKAIPHLIKALNDEDGDVRSSAVYALSNIGGPKVVEPVLEAMNDKDIGVRYAVVYALGDIGGPKVVDGLLKLLNDENISIQCLAAESLGEVGEPKAIDALIKALGRRYGCVCGGECVRRSFRRALRKFGEAAVGKLMKALAEKNRTMRAEAAKVLGSIGDARATDALIEALKDVDGDVRMNAAEALGRIGDKRAVTPLTEALKDGDDSVRYYAAEALGRLGSREATNALIGTLNDGSWSVREATAEALGKIKDKKAVDALIETLNDEKALVRAKAVEALGRIGDERAVVPLLALIDDKREVYQALKGALRRIGSPAVERLIGLMRSGNCRAVHLLASIKDERAVDALIEALESEDLKLRYHAAFALAKTADKKATLPLIKALKDKDFYVRQGAAFALGKIRDERAVDSLIEAYRRESECLREDGSTFVYRAIIRALGSIGGDKAVDALATLLAEGRKGAAEALGKTGDERAIEPLKKAINTTEGKHIEAIKALGSLEHPEALRALVEAVSDDDTCRTSKFVLLELAERIPDELVNILNDKRWFIRMVAAETLGKIEYTGAVGALINTLKDPDRDVRYAAEKALKRIGTEAEEHIEKALQTENSDSTRRILQRILKHIRKGF